MKKKYLYGIIVIVFLLIIQRIQSNVPSIESSQDGLCGPKSLLAICMMFDISTTIEEVCKLSDYSEKSGTTMLGLYKAATQKGLPAVPVKIDIDQLCTFKSPSIVFVDGDHFLVVQGCKSDRVIIQNPPDKSINISKEDFQKRWNGEALVFSEILKKQMTPKIAEKTVPPKGPHIHFYQTEYNFGVVDEGDVLSHKFKFINIGTDTLKVSARSTCSCTAAVLSDKTIPPGDSGEIFMKYDTKGRKGYTTQSIDVRTNNLEKRWARLTLSATIKMSTRILPEKLWLDEISIGEVISREIFVVDSGDKTLIVKKVDIPEGITAEIMPVRENSTVKRSIPVILTIKGGTKPGYFEKLVTVYTNDTRRSEIVVPISGIVLGELKALPPTIFFGDVKPNTAVVREIILSPTNEKRLEIARAISSSPYISTEVQTIGNGLKFKLIATLQAPGKDITVRYNIPVYVNGRDYPAMEIPVYAKVVVSQK